MKVTNEINEYHLHPKEASKRQFDFFDLEEYLEKNIEHSSKPHSHSFYQLIWFHSNNGKHFIDFESFDIEKDRIFFIAKNQIHYFEKRKDYRGVLLHFNESFLLQNEKDIEFFIDYDLFNNLESPYFQVPSNLKSELDIYINQIKQEVDKIHSFGHRSILTYILKSLLITVEREKRTSIRKASSFSSSSSLLQFRKLLEIGYSKNWPVAKYAQELNVSTKTLNNSIKSETGKTTSSMIKHRIILEAKRQLCHSGSFVSEIGYNLGFEDPSYFVKFFKKHVNLTPSEFRRSIS